MTVVPIKALLSLALMLLDPNAFYQEIAQDDRIDRDQETVYELKAAGKLARRLAINLLSLNSNISHLLLLKHVKTVISADLWTEIGVYVEVPSLPQEVEYAGGAPPLFQIP